jgi:hypothetical protein
VQHGTPAHVTSQSAAPAAPFCFFFACYTTNAARHSRAQHNTSALVASTSAAAMSCLQQHLQHPSASSMPAATQHSTARYVTGRPGLSRAVASTVTTPSLQRKHPEPYSFQILTPPQTPTHPPIQPPPLITRKTHLLLLPLCSLLCCSCIHLCLSCCSLRLRWQQTQGPHTRVVAKVVVAGGRGVRAHVCVCGGGGGGSASTQFGRSCIHLCLSCLALRLGQQNTTLQHTMCSPAPHNIDTYLLDATQLLHQTAHNGCGHGACGRGERG